MPWGTPSVTSSFVSATLPQATENFEFALGLCRERGNRSGEAWILTHLGDAHHAAGKRPQARLALQQALAIYDDMEHSYAGKVRAELARTEK